MAVLLPPRCFRIQAVLSDPSPHAIRPEDTRESYRMETCCEWSMTTTLRQVDPQLAMSTTLTVAKFSRELVEKKNPGEWLLRICNRAATPRYAPGQSRTVWILYGGGLATMVRINYPEEEEEEEWGETVEPGYEEEDDAGQVSVCLKSQGKVLDPTSPMVNHLSRAGSGEVIPVVISTEGRSWPTTGAGVRAGGKTRVLRVWEHERRPGRVKRMW